MKVSDLRIGNWVKYKKGHLGTISHIDYTGLIGLTNNDYLDGGVFELSHFEPIPLTEEWLEKFGFDYFGDDRWELKEFRLIKYNITNDWVYSCDEQQPIIKHVHTLQNLYYCLTGNELTIHENTQI